MASTDRSYIVGTVVLIPLDFDVTAGVVTAADVEVAVIEPSAAVETAVFGAADSVGTSIGYGLGFTPDKTLAKGAYRLLTRITANPEKPIDDAGIFYVVEAALAPNRGVAPPDLTTPVGLVRLMTGDNDPKNVTDGQGTYLWFSDAEVQALVTGKGGVDQAAIFILRLVSMTQAMKLKKWTSADLSVDGPAITRALTEAINAIEAGLVSAEIAASSDYFKISPVGRAVYQPHFYDDDIPYDRSLPWII